MSNAAVLACYRAQPILQDELVNGEVWTNLGGLYNMEIQQITKGNGHEVAYAFQWLYSTLHGDSTLMGYVSGVYRGLAPATSTAPFVVMIHQSGSDVINMSGTRLITNLLFQIKVVGPANLLSTSLMSAAERIDVLLGGTVSGPAGGLI
jgi:hypothetical protein